MPTLERLAQRANDTALKSRRASVRRCGRLFRRALLRAGDPIIDIDVEGIKIRAPLSHELPHYRQAYPLYAVNVATVAQLVSETEERPTLIDIGANVGDTAALVRSRISGFATLCIEADSHYAALLRQNVAGWPDVEVHAPCLLAEERGVLSGALTRSGGTAAFNFDEVTDIASATLDDVLADYPDFAAPSIIKTDTDGFEGRVLAGSLGTIDRAHPILFFEFDPRLLQTCGTDSREFLGMLREHGYSAAVVYDNFGQVIDLVDVQDAHGIESIDRLALDPLTFYLDVAAFPIGKEKDAAELYRRERGNTREAHV